MVIRFEEVLPVGDRVGTLVIPAFAGTLNDQLAGFYRSEFTNENGQKELMAVCHFEPLDARRAFPCVDEPHRKAIFRTTITVANQTLTALSNMPERDRKILPNGKVRVQFMPTPLMSSYIICFVVGRLEAISAYTNNGTLVRAFSVPGRS